MMPIRAMRMKTAGGSGPTGATPTWISRTTSVFNSNTTAHLVTMPATVDAGDLLIIEFGFGASYTVTTPSGWTIAHDQTNIGISVGHIWFFKSAVGTEDGTTVDCVTSAGTRACAHVHRITSGTWSGTPEGASASTGSSTTTPDPANLTPSWGSANTLWIIGAEARNVATVSVYPGSNGAVTAATSISTIMSCTDTTAGASLDPGTFTMSVAAPWIATTLGVSPIP